MLIKTNQYVPILKWRQGEYQALSRLKDQNKEIVVPLLVIPPIEYDFEERRLKKTIQEHIESFPRRFHSKWGNRKAMIDIHNSIEEAVMDNGTSVINFIFEELAKTSCKAIPVINLSRSPAFLSTVRQIAKTDNLGVCARITLLELTSIDLNSKMRELGQKLGVTPSQIDLVIDLGHPKSFEPYAAFSKALVNAINKIEALESYRSFAIVATSLELSAIKAPGGELTRHEWKLYKQLVHDLGDTRIPSYGDYSIENPDFSDLDMRQIKPAGKIVFAGDDVWLIPKGPAFRGNESQMTRHCKLIVDSVHWQGPDYSHGDKIIYETALELKGTGNLSTWKQVGVSRHLAKVAEQLSMFHAS